jgi:acid phosphatase (class A)
MNINDIKYGTVPLYHIESFKTGIGKTVLDESKGLGIIDKFLEYPPSENESEETINELKHLVQLQKTLTDEDKKLCYVLEDKHYKFFALFCEKIGIDGETEESIKSLSQPFDGLMVYVKLKFNRPRPHQLAIYPNIPLFPLIGTDANSPAYPSGHSLDFFIIIHKLKEKYPQYSTQFDSLYDKIKDIREKSGVHYLSDRYAAELLFNLLLNNGLISKF